MIVVADTSPLNYLVLIDEIAVLPTLFERLLVPQAVLTELLDAKAPSMVRAWALEHPAWLEIRDVTAVVHPALLTLDQGEQQALQLALDLGLPTMLMDEAAGRRVAAALHLQVRGTLGILEEAARIGLLDLGAALERLGRTNFRLSPAVREYFNQKLSAEPIDWPRRHP